MVVLTVPNLGIKRERGTGDISPKASAAPATVSGESSVNTPLGTSAPGKAAEGEDP